MPLYMTIPLEVFGLGAVISFGIALLIKFLLKTIKVFAKKTAEQ